MAQSQSSSNGGKTLWWVMGILAGIIVSAIGTYFATDSRGELHQQQEQVRLLQEIDKRLVRVETIVKGLQNAITRPEFEALEERVRKLEESG